MEITHLRLKNWRNFPAADVAISRRTFVYGPNASGKTNFLDALRFLRDIARPGGGIRGAVDDRGGFAAIRSLHAHGTKQHIELAIEALDGSTKWKYELHLSSEGTGAKRVPVVLTEVVHKNGREVDRRPTSDDVSDPARLRETHLESLRSNQKYRELAEGLAAIEYMHLVPHVVKYPERAPRSESNGMGGHLLAEIAGTPKKRRESLLRKVNKGLAIALPEFADLECEVDEAGMPRLKAKYMHWRKEGSWQREDQFSDGTLRLIALLWKLADDRNKSVLLLEEPELSLHSDLVRQLPRIFSSIAGRGRQVIFSSHAEELLEDDGIEPSEIVLLEPAQGTQVRLASDDHDVVAVAKAGGKIAPLVVAKTRPKNAGLLATFGQ